MIGWKPFSILWPAAALLGSERASGAITSASPITSTAHRTLRFIMDLLGLPTLSPDDLHCLSVPALILLRTTTQAPASADGVTCARARRSGTSPGGARCGAVARHRPRLRAADGACAPSMPDRVAAR